MVAKIPLSKRRLITSLARTSSFSESSLMAMPSVIVILRVVGTSSGGTGLGGSGGGTPGRRWGGRHGSRHRRPCRWNAARGKSAGRRGRHRPSRSGMHWPWLAGPPGNRGAHRRNLRSLRRAGRSAGWPRGRGAQAARLALVCRARWHWLPSARLREPWAAPVGLPSPRRHAPQEPQGFPLHPSPPAPPLEKVGD